VARRLHRAPLHHGPPPPLARRADAGCAQNRSLRPGVNRSGVAMATPQRPPPRCGARIASTKRGERAPVTLRRLAGCDAALSGRGCKRIRRDTCCRDDAAQRADAAELWRRRALEREQPSLFRLQDFQDEPWIAAICSVNRIEILRVSPSPAISVWTDCTVQTLLLQLCFGLTRPLTISRWVTGCRVTSEQAARRMG
jgi:hypothetical protein